MKKIISTIKILVFGCVFLSFASCQDFMETGSNRYVSAEDNLLNSPNDTVYSIVGILTKVQALSDKYVLMGELRGDLMDVSETADDNLQRLNDFDVDTTSTFANVKEFYAVINNCNYLIHKADTSLVLRNNKPFLKEVAIAKTIRAWSYMQLVLNYGHAYYCDKPILTLKEAQAYYPRFDQAQMIDTLIASMESIRLLDNFELPDYNNMNSESLKQLFINPFFVMGDLHLWRASLNHNPADYEQAAVYYAKLIEKGLYANCSKRVTWSSDLFKITTGSIVMNDNISITKMVADPTQGTTWEMPSLSKDMKIFSSVRMDSIFAAQKYCYKTSTSVDVAPKFGPNGDLRKTTALNKIVLTDNAGVTDPNLPVADKFYIAKYDGMAAHIYRGALLYLRYAEAVNRIGKPNLAFVVLKYGLNSINLPLYVPATERADQKPYFTFLSSTEVLKNEFDKKNTRGVHDGGSGDSNYNVDYKIPECSNLNDSIAAVEDLICDELALETGFEGNRFQDLMRLSNHRGNTAYLAKKVARKHVVNSGDVYGSAIYQKLLIKDNWYLPAKRY